MTAAPLRRSVAPCVLVALLGLGLPGLASGQDAAALTGRIADTAGAPIRGASVRIPQLERAAVTDSAGRYRVEGLPTGRVTVVGEAPGFAGKRVEVTMPANGTLEQAFTLVPNARVLAAVEVRARARRQLPMRLQEFEVRRNRGLGRFLSPDDLAKFSGRPLTDALKSVMVGARFQRTATGEVNIVSARALNQVAIGSAANQRGNMKPCGIQIWQDGALLSDPNQAAEVMLEQRADQMGPGGEIGSQKIGADRDYDVSNLLSNAYSAVEYYSDLASTPPGFRTATPSCGTLVLWTRLPGDAGEQVGRRGISPADSARPQ